MTAVEHMLIGEQFGAGMDASCTCGRWTLFARSKDTVVFAHERHVARQADCDIIEAALLVGPGVNLQALAALSRLRGGGR